MDLETVKPLKLESQYDEQFYAYLKIQHSGEELEFMYPKCDNTIIDTFTQEPKFTELALLQFVQSMNMTGVYIDCGGYLGMHSLYHKKYSKATKVYCFEPNPVMYKCAVENTRKESDIYVFNTAVGNRQEEAYLNNVDNCTYGQYTLLNHESVFPMFKVQVDTIDNVILPLLEEGERVAYIKLDIEGYEGEALIGATKLINKYNPVIYTEIWRINKVYKHIYKILTDLGYEIMYSTEEHYFWRYKYTSLDIRKEQRELDEYLSYVGTQTKHTTLYNYFGNKKEVIRTYVTNNLSINSTLLMQTLSTQYTNTRFIGFDKSKKVVDEAINFSKHNSLNKNSHLFLGDLTNTYSKFGDRDIYIYDLYFETDNDVSFLLNNIDNIIRTIHEGGLLILNFNFNLIKNSSTVLSLLEYLEQEYLIVKQNITSERFFYTLSGSETNKIYYIHL